MNDAQEISPHNGLAQLDRGATRPPIAASTPANFRWISLINETSIPCARRPIDPVTFSSTCHSADEEPPSIPWQEKNGHLAHLSESLHLLEHRLPLRRRLVHAGDLIYRVGERFTDLHIIHSGVFKVINHSIHGREQLVSLPFKGDWLGFDGISGGYYGCDVVAMDTGELWSVSYETLMEASINDPALLSILHRAMSHEIERDRDWLMSLCTLSADARVAEFLRCWITALAYRGLRTDKITLRMTRAEIGNYLGLTLESVSRALSRLVREQVICFAEKGRRELRIPDATALARFVQTSLNHSPPVVPARRGSKIASNQKDSWRSAENRA